MNLYMTECNHKASDSKMFMPCEINVPNYLSIAKRTECWLENSWFRQIK